MACVQEAFLRNKVRKLLGIEGSVAADIGTSFLCHCCGLVQEDAEVKKWQERQYEGTIQPGGAKPEMMYRSQNA